MSTETTGWRRTGERCKRGDAIEQRIVRQYISGGTETHWDDVETRCCRACEAEE